MTVASLTGFGGIGEIGGNAFLLDDGKSSLLLDFGKRFGNDELVEEAGLRPGWNDYWDEFLKPRTFHFVPDLLALGLVPSIPGLYRQDLGGDPKAPAVGAIVVTHAHQDHYGLLGLVKPGVPILASPDSRAALHSIQETGPGGAEFDLTQTSSRGNLGRTSKGALSNRPRFGDGPSRAFSDRAKVDVGAWNVELLPVDHSIHGACGAIVSGPSVSLAYTGDFRFHGRNGAWSERFVERAQGVDFLLTEGTRVHRPEKRKDSSTDKEVDVEGQIVDFISQDEKQNGRTGFVGVAFPPRDLDRFLSVYNVAKRTGRRLVVPMKLAHLLETFRAADRTDLPDPRVDSSMAIHLRAKRTGTAFSKPKERLAVARDDLTVEHVAVSDDEFVQCLLGDYDPWERVFVEDGKNLVSSPDVGKEPGAYLFSISYWTISEMIDIFPEPSKGRGLYVHSATQPFNDEMEQNDRKLNRWLKLFNLIRKDTHVSGHLDAEMLEWVVDKVKPKVLLPVHTLADSYTADRYTARTGQKAMLCEYGRPLPLA